MFKTAWCLFFRNHWHGGSLQTFSFNGCCLHFPPKSRHPADLPLQKCNGLDVLSTEIIGMGDLFRLSSPTQRSRLFLQGNFSLMPWFSQEIKVTAVSGGRLKNLSKPIIFQFETSGVIFEGKKSLMSLFMHEMKATAVSGGLLKNHLISLILRITTI